MRLIFVAFQGIDKVKIPSRAKRKIYATDNRFNLQIISILKNLGIIDE